MWFSDMIFAPFAMNLNLNRGRGTYERQCSSMVAVMPKVFSSIGITAMALQFTLYASVCIFGDHFNILCHEIFTTKHYNDISAIFS